MFSISLSQSYPHTSRHVTSRYRFVQQRCVTYVLVCCSLSIKCEACQAQARLLVYRQCFPVYKNSRLLYLRVFNFVGTHARQRQEGIKLICLDRLANLISVGLQLSLSILSNKVSGNSINRYLYVRREQEPKQYR